MNLFDLVPTENDPSYQALQVSNLDRQYSFLRSVVSASLETDRIYVSQTVLRAFNYHAIVCLHSDAGNFRRYDVNIGNGENHKPPAWIYVQAQMDDLVNRINTVLLDADPVVLASYTLWRLNWIHPFINGNGRTARLAAYYILCMRFGGMLPGKVSLPELLRRDRDKEDDPYVMALRKVDESIKGGSLELGPLHELLSNLLEEQLKSSNDQP